MHHINFELTYIKDVAFNIGDYVMIRIRPERRPSGLASKLQARSAGPFKILKQVGPNAYVIDIPSHFGFHHTFNVEDLVAYKGPPSFPDDPFLDTTTPNPEPIPTPAPLPSLPALVDKIDAILDEQVVFTTDGAVQRFLVRWVNKPDSECTWVTRDILQQLDPDMLELYRSHQDLLSPESSSSHPGDTRFRPPLIRVYERAKKKTAQPLSLWLGT
jgi:hypothetical protein